MTEKRFSLAANVSTENPGAIQTELERLFGKGSVVKVGENGFRIQTEMKGEDAKELNRQLLSGLRRVERKTRLRAEWTCGETTERFFDYVLKKTMKKDAKR
jgi:hypothetical protein